MDLTQLTIFQTVVREGGVSKAALRLHRVQSNITTRVRQLEDELGVELFIREGKRMHLSPAGKTLLEYADRLLALAEEARDAVQNPRPRGIFRLGAMESTAAVRLPRPITRYHKLYPDVDLQLRTGNPQQLINGLLTAELDAALVAEPVNTTQFDSIVAFEEKLVLVTAVDHEEITANGDLPTTIIAFEHGCPHRKRLESWYDSRECIPHRTIELSSYHAMLGCVVVGMGIALLPQSVLSTFPERKRLKIHELPKERNSVKTLLIWRRGRGSANTEALVKLLSSQSDMK